MGEVQLRPIPQIVAALRADAGVSSVVGQQVYADYPPQGVDEPFVVITITSTIGHGTVNNCAVRAYSSRFTVDVAANTRAQTEVGIEAAEDVLNSLVSSDADFPIQGITVDGGIQWELLTPKDGSDGRIFVGTQDYQVHYRRN